MFRPSGRTYSRSYVPQEGSPAHLALVAKAGACQPPDGPEDEPGDVAIMTKARCWRPLA